MKSPFVRFHLPLLAYAVAILALSSVPNLRTPVAETWPVDKLAHFVEYAVLAWLVYRSSARWHSELKGGAVLWIVLLGPTCWALLDEWIQGHVPGRFSDWRDLVADALGVLLVVAIIQVRNRYRPAGDQ